MKNHKGVKEFSQNGYICIADTLPIWNDIRIADMGELSAIAQMNRRLGR